VGKIPGGGRIQILERFPGRWDHLGTLNIPPAVDFEDYSGIDIQDDRVAIVSQQSSALWIGKLQKSGWGFVDNGVIYLFPRRQGKILYRNIEGVCWISDNKIVVVSDKNKKNRHDGKDQSIHIFKIPNLPW
jgi:hypothetical protein